MSVGQRSELRLVNNSSQSDYASFALQQVVRGGLHTLILTGELDLLSAPKLASAVANIRMDRSTALVLDLRRVTFVDARGIRAILVIQELCAERECGFSLVPGRRQVQRLFELCGLLDHLPFRDDEGYVGSDLSGVDSRAGTTS